jgi:hypothetical protein
MENLQQPPLIDNSCGLETRQTPWKNHGTNQQISPPTSCEPQKSAPRQALLRDPAGYELCLVADLDMAATPATSHARRELFSGS